MKLTNNFLLLPNDSLNVGKLLHDAGRSPDDVSKIINTTGISRIRYAYPKLFTEFVFDGLESIHKQHNQMLTWVFCPIVTTDSGLS